MSRLEIADTNRQRCSICKKCIPKEVERLNIGHRSDYGTISQRRVCGLCIIETYKKLHKAPVKKWCAEMVAKAI